MSSDRPADSEIIPPEGFELEEGAPERREGESVELPESGSVVQE